MFSTMLFEYVLSLKLGLAALASLFGQWAFISFCLCFEALELVYGMADFGGEY